MENSTSRFNTLMTSKRAEEKGQAYIRVGRILSLIGLITFAASLFLTLILALAEVDEEVLYIFVALGGIGLSLLSAGLFFYFFGLHLFALARIAVNTEPSNNSAVNNYTSREALSANPSVAGANPHQYDELLRIGAISKEEYDILTSGSKS